LNADRFHIVLVEPEIASNTGNIGRTCVAVGAKLWLVRPLGFRIDDRHLRRAGLDYWPYLDWQVVDSLQEVRDVLAPRRLWYFSTKATRVYTEATFELGDALVFGPETRGLSPHVREEAGDFAVRIPILPQARSLNLANAVAVGLYEAVRQTSGRGQGRS
jgi:tRNA (cytidine/uridine-2'-O-)-methyltransferase